MLLLIFSHVNKNFFKLKLYCRTYTLIKVIQINKYVKFRVKKEFSVTAPNLQKETYVVHLAGFNASTNLFLSLCIAQKLFERLVISI